jgi:hypothetical protein
MNKRIRFLTIVPLLVVGHTASGGVIPNGGSISETIANPGEVDTHTFSATAGQQGVISVTGDVTGGEFIRILDPDDSELDTTGNRADLTLTQTGIYTVEVSSFQSTGTGAYTVHLALAAGADEHGNIPNGGSATEAIDADGELDSFTFTGTAGQQGVISISGDVTGGELYRVFNPDGTLLASDGAQKFVTLPQTGTYTVVVSSFQASGTGSYAVHLALAPGANEHGTIPNGGFAVEAIDADGEIDSFTFSGTAGQQGVISISGDVTGGEFFRVFNPDGTLLGDNGSQESVTLLQSGTYTIVVSSFQPSGTGSYTLNLSLNAPPDAVLMPDPLTFGELAIGATASEILIVENTGDVGLQLGVAAISGVHGADFGIGNDGCAGELLANGDFCGIEITFSPSAAGIRRARLQVPSKAPDSPEEGVLIGSNDVLFSDGFEQTGPAVAR